MLVTVDLGLRVSGIALWADGEMTAAYEVRVSTGRPRDMARALWRHGARFAPRGALWVAERMKDYRGKGARKKALRRLRQVSTGLADLMKGTGHCLKLYTAAEWKGSTPKPICHARIWPELTAAERVMVVPASKETLDAVGIGLFELARLGRGMTRPRPRATRSR